MFSFARGLAHGQKGIRRGDGRSNTDKCLLRNMATPRSGQCKNSRSQEGKSQTEEISTAPVRVHSYQDRDRRTQGSDLGQRQVHENHAAFDYVHTQVGVNPGENQTGHKWPQQKWKDVHHSPVTGLPGTLWSTNRYRNQKAENSPLPASRRRLMANTALPSHLFRAQWSSGS